MTTVTNEERHLAECRYISRLSLSERRAWLEQIEYKRGARAVERIKATLTKWHEENKK